jgi:nucleoside-diphosphate-sugar epimerase
MAVNSSVIAVTGANGFVGRAFCTRARMRGRELRRLVHQASEPEDAVALDLACASIDEMARRLEGVGTVVHLAGRAHVIKDVAADPESAYRDANEHATARIARAAVAAGARRFILASTVKVNGESTAPGRPFQPDDVVAPQDAYARSKLAAEAALAQAARGTSMGAITLRLPLVHGAGARGNFRRLVDAVRDGRWLPFGAIHNRRSLIGIDNLVDALDAAIDAPQRIEGVHFVADADGVSTPRPGTRDRARARDRGSAAAGTGPDAATCGPRRRSGRCHRAPDELARSRYGIVCRGDCLAAASLCDRSRRGYRLNRKYPAGI